MLAPFMKKNEKNATFDFVRSGASPLSLMLVGDVPDVDDAVVGPGVNELVFADRCVALVDLLEPLESRLGVAVSETLEFGLVSDLQKTGINVISLWK